MITLRIQNTWIALALLGFIISFVILSIPLKNGWSVYPYNELIRDLAVVKNLDQGEWVSLGPPASLGGYHFGPAYYYLLYPVAKLLNFDARSLAVASTVFMTLTIAGVFALTKKWWGSEWLALSATFIATFSVLSFQLAKYSSNPNFIPFFIILFFYAITRLIDDSKNLTYSVFLGVAFAVLIQLHAFTLLAVPVILLLAWRLTGLKTWPWSNILVFIITVLVIHTPYIYYELTHDFINMRALFGIAGGDYGYYISHLIQYLGFLLNPIFAMHGFFDAFEVGGSWFAGLVVGVLLLIPVVLRYNSTHLKYILIEPPVKLSVDTKRLLGIWFIVPTAIFIWPWGGVQEFHYYYFFVLMPLLYIALGWGLYRIFRSGLHLLGGYLTLSFLILQLAQVFLYVAQFYD